MLEEGDNFKTEFWSELLPVEVQKNIISLPSTIEQLKEAKRVYDDINGALESYNNFMPRNQYFKPHTANAKRFLHNAELINRQIKIHNASIECICSFLGIEGKEFSKLLRYFLKPRRDSIKISYKSKLIKQNLILRLHKSLKSSLKLRWDNEYNDKNDERLFERNFQWEARKQKWEEF